MKRAQNPGRCSKESYAVGETVLVQNVKDKMWDREGVITEVRVAHDGCIVSFGLEIQGHPSTRHRRYLRKAPAADTAPSSDHVPITGSEQQQEELVFSPARQLRSGRRGRRS